MSLGEVRMVESSGTLARDDIVGLVEASNGARMYLPCPKSSPSPNALVA